MFAELALEYELVAKLVAVVIAVFWYTSTFCINVIAVALVLDELKAANVKVFEVFATAIAAFAKRYAVSRGCKLYSGM
jgi:hypothetical protein